MRIKSNGKVQNSYIEKKITEQDMKSIATIYKEYVCELESIHKEFLNKMERLRKTKDLEKITSLRAGV